MTEPVESVHSARWIGPRLRFLPILLVLAIGIAAVYLAFFLAAFVHHLSGAAVHWPAWLNITIAETFELVFALIGIAIARRLLPSADFGLRWPPARTYLGWAAFWGLAFALIMLVADQWPSLIAMRAPMPPETPTAVNIAGWLGFELLWVGICEETLFRGLLLGILTALSPSKLRIWGTEISTAGITLAVLFALAHAANSRQDLGMKRWRSRSMPSRSGSSMPGFASIRRAWSRRSSLIRWATSARRDWCSCSLACSRPKQILSNC